ncbi:response regulator transcription factor [Alteromonas sp. a30]|uniref:response regulator transcription factor n=1 Tax=Alteromonas sp. a30 TaxID=2730917 RepID=UPI002282CE29|nr:response regulator transcription factor [Alteromonas sp. a30]MCY7297186.1 response regulator transcription factor [Alteromonas sp. a30]
MLTVLLVEDDRDLAETVIQFLGIHNIDCDYASNGQYGVNLLQKNNYDVLLLDINLPRVDGITLCQQARDNGNNTPVLMLTARDQLKDKIAGFNSGADDFLVKPFALQELLLRIQALSRRRNGHAKVLKHGVLSMNINMREITLGEEQIHVSPIGWKLLEVLLRHAPEAVARERLQSAVWGDEIPDSNSLKVHIHKLRKALNVEGEAPLLHTIPGYGFAIQERKAL